MNERQWWSHHVKSRLHVPGAKCTAWKVQDAFNAGLPDVLFSVPGSKAGLRLNGLLELKYDPAWPARATTSIDIGLTAEQFRHLDHWARQNNDPRLAVVLFGVGKDWWLFPHSAAVLAPGTKWLKDQIIKSAWCAGEGYSSLSTVWEQLANRPKFKE